MNKFVIIDGNAIIYRAYHAIPPLTDKNGQVVNAVYGFASTMLKVWKELQPKYLAVTFDMAGPTFRHKQYKKYKATRVKADQELYDQIPLVHDLVEAFNIPIYEKTGFEADDVIGTIVKNGKWRVGNNIEIYIVTGDMDTLQLVTDKVKVYTLRKGMSDIVIYDPGKVKDKYGFGPEMVVDYKALRGDPSDNIPGIVGVGKKTATDLILKFGSVENIYKELKTQNKEQKIKELLVKKLKSDKKNAFLSKKLATIDCDVPNLKFDLQKCKLKDFNREKVIKLFQKLEFTSLLKRISGTDLGQIQGIGKQEQKKSKQINTKLKFIEIKKQSEVKDLIIKIKKNKLFACKEVISGSGVLDGELQGLIIVIEDKVYWFENKFINRLDCIFKDKEVELIGHNLKRLWKAILLFSTFNFQPSIKLFDIMVASYLLNPGTRSNDPAGIILKTLGKELPNSCAQGNLFEVDYRSVGEELFLLFQCVDKIKQQLAQVNNLGLLQKIEIPLTKILAEMELNGVGIDKKKLNEMSKQIKIKINKIKKEIYKLAGEEFNISSSVQLRDILFEKIELPTQGIKKGKTGYSTNSAQLEKLRDIHPIIKELKNYRELEKLRNTYIDVLPILINNKTKRIHTTFNQVITTTGRLSSSDPNLQNIPIRTDLGREIRKAFVAEKGNSLIVADYSQIELRIVASLAKDKTMIKIFNEDLDIHKATAAIINNVSLDKVTNKMRSSAKAVNFGILYGMGSYGLSSRTGLTNWEAKDFIKKYFEQFKEVKKYLDATLKFSKKEGYCETLFGRRRYLPELSSSNFQIRSSAERMAINHPIQGTAADLMKMAMIKVDSRIKSEFGESYLLQEEALKNEAGCVSSAKIILQVHDELVLEVKKGLEKGISKLVKKTMESIVKLNVPVKVKVKWGKKWGEIK